MSVNSQAIVGRHARAIRILTCLQAGPAFNAKELSLKLNVSRRTIYRDLNLIRDAGIDIQFDSQDSGYRIEGGPEKPLTPPNFSQRDLAKLALTSHLSVLNGLPQFAVSTRESLSRMLAHYPRKVRNSVAHVLSCCAVELPQPGYGSQPVDVIETLLGAIATQKKVRLDLAPGTAVDGEAGTTDFSVYRLIAGIDDWWIVGRSTLHDRTVRLPTSSIRSIRPLHEDYRIPHSFRSRLLESQDAADTKIA